MARKPFGERFGGFGTEKPVSASDADQNEKVSEKSSRVSQQQTIKRKKVAPRNLRPQSKKGTPKAPKTVQASKDAAEASVPEMSESFRRHVIENKHRLPVDQLRDLHRDLDELHERCQREFAETQVLCEELGIPSVHDEAVQTIEHEISQLRRSVRELEDLSDQPIGAFMRAKAPVFDQQSVLQSSIDNFSHIRERLETQKAQADKAATEIGQLDVVEKGQTGFTAAPEGVSNLEQVESLDEAMVVAVKELNSPDGFSRSQLMAKVRSILPENATFSREEGLRAFVALLRSGGIVKIIGGHFVASESLIEDQTTDAVEAESEAVLSDVVSDTTKSSPEDFDVADQSELSAGEQRGEDTIEADVSDVDQAFANGQSSVSAAGEDVNGSLDELQPDDVSGKSADLPVVRNLSTQGSQESELTDFGRLAVRERDSSGAGPETSSVENDHGQRSRDLWGRVSFEPAVDKKSSEDLFFRPRPRLVLARDEVESTPAPVETVVKTEDAYKIRNLNTLSTSQIRGAIADLETARDELPEGDVRGTWQLNRQIARYNTGLYNRELQSFYQAQHSNKFKSVINNARTFGRELFGLKPKLPPELAALRQQELAAQQAYLTSSEQMRSERSDISAAKNTALAEKLQARVLEKHYGGRSLVDLSASEQAVVRREVLDTENRLQDRLNRQLDFATAINRMQERNLAQKEAIARGPKIESLEAMKRIMAGKRGMALRIGAYAAVGAATGGLSGAIGAATGVVGGIGGGIASRWGYGKAFTRNTEAKQAAVFAKKVYASNASQLEVRRKELEAAMAATNTSESRKAAAGILGAIAGGGIAGGLTPDSAAEVSAETPVEEKVPDPVELKDSDAVIAGPTDPVEEDIDTSANAETTDNAAAETEQQVETKSNETVQSTEEQLTVARQTLDNTYESISSKSYADISSDEILAAKATLVEQFTILNPDISPSALDMAAERALADALKVSVPDIQEKLSAEAVTPSEPVSTAETVEVERQTIEAARAEVDKITLKLQSVDSLNSVDHIELQESMDELVKQSDLANYSVGERDVTDFVKRIYAVNDEELQQFLIDGTLPADIQVTDPDPVPAPDTPEPIAPVDLSQSARPEVSVSTEPASPELAAEFPVNVYEVKAGDPGISYELIKQYPDVFPPEGSSKWLSVIEQFNANPEALKEAGFTGNPPNINNIYPGDKIDMSVLAEKLANGTLR